MGSSIDKLNKLRLNRLRQQKQEYEFLKKLYQDRGKDVTDYTAKIEKIDRIIKSIDKKEPFGAGKALLTKQDDVFLTVLFFIIFCSPLWKPIVWGLVHQNELTQRFYELFFNTKQLFIAGFWTLLLVFAMKGFAWSLAYGREKEEPPTLFQLPFINRQGETDTIMQFWSLALLLVVWYYFLGVFNISFK